jgi:hypothetical protein
MVKYSTIRIGNSRGSRYSARSVLTHARGMVNSGPWPPDPAFLRWQLGSIAGLALGKTPCVPAAVPPLAATKSGL